MRTACAPHVRHVRTLCTLCAQALQLIFMARRLYTTDGCRLSADQKSDLNRRFAEGAKRLLLENESPPAELVKLSAELSSYYARLQALGVSDHQVPRLRFSPPPPPPPLPITTLNPHRPPQPPPTRRRFVSRFSATSTTSPASSG